MSHIVIDARMVGYPLHGIARHTQSLIRSLEKLDRHNRYTLLVNDDTLRHKTSFELKSVRSRWLSLAEQIELPTVLKKLKADLFHSPSISFPFFCPIPFMITVHDLNHIAFKEGKRLGPLFLLHTCYYQTVLKKALHTAKHIITVSEFTKNEIITYFRIPPKKIKVIHNGIDTHFVPIDDKDSLAACKKKYILPTPFILYIGNNKKHKNLDRMLTAYKDIKKNIALVILGAHSPLLPTDNIRYLTAVEEGDLPALYTLAALVVFPSLYEGFGFPALEALACAKPLITSATSSLPEVVGEAAILIDPTHTASLSEALNMAIEKNLISTTNTKGLLQAKKFSWAIAAQKTLELYESCHRP